MPPFEWCVAGSFENRIFQQNPYSIRQDKIKGISISPRPAAAVNNDGDIRGVFLEK